VGRNLDSDRIPADVADRLREDLSGRRPPSLEERVEVGGLSWELPLRDERASGEPSPSLTLAPPR
jgi:hypothetical protein